jgi:putative toxin-antitoxin system antitoxin component (TIGR02293 family)
MAEFLGISDRTYERRSREGRLREAESVKVEFLESLLALAADVFRDEAKGRGWLGTPLVPFGNNTPLQMLDSVQGYERVRNALNRIRYGMY